MGGHRREPAGVGTARFGPFEVNLEAEVLHKNGVRVRLPHQSFQILARLLERPGETVTRRDLREELWPDESYGDFDRCLNTAVNRLRHALGDSAEKPRYILTVPREGYRFLAAVEWDQGSPAAESVGGTGTERASGRWRFLAVTALAVIAGVLVGAWVWRHWTAAPQGSLGAHPLIAKPGAKTTPSFSPDGRKIVFSWRRPGTDNYDVYSIDIRSQDLKCLTTSPGQDLAPVYSPDGRRIAFYRNTGVSSAVYMIPSPGEPPIRLLGLSVGPPGPGSPSAGGVWTPGRLAWDPSGEFIAAVDKESPDHPFAIFLVEAAQRGLPEPLTKPPPDFVGDGDPAISPDGRYLAFVRRKTEQVGDIYVAGLGGGSLRRLTKDGRNLSGLTWSADGRHIIYSAERAGHRRLFRVSLAGGPPQLLLLAGREATLPAVAPRGDRLAYVRPAWGTSICRVRLRGAPGRRSAAETLPLETGASTMNPQVSPDGSVLLFSAGDLEKKEIWTYDLRTSRTVRLTSLGSNSASPRWSPDGKRIAFDSPYGGGLDIFVASAEGGEAVRLTTHPAEDILPSWSVDGKWIYFTSDRSGTMQVWKIPAEGGEAVQITRRGAFVAVPAPDGQFVYFVRRTPPGIWKVPVDGGEETLAFGGVSWGQARNWVPVREGIYFLAQDPAADAPGSLSVNFFRFSTQRVERLVTLEATSAVGAGCSISPDGEWFYFVRRESDHTDIMLVEGFRCPPAGESLISVLP